MVQVERREYAKSGKLSLSLQPRGAVLGGVGVAVLVAGLWRVDGVMASLGLSVCGLLVVSWWIARLNSSAVEISLNCPEKVRAGVVFPLWITLRNPRGWIDTFNIRIDLHLAGQTRCGGRASWVAARSAADLELKVTVPARCRADVHPVRLISDFPFGFFEAVKRVEIPQPLMVLPRPVVPRGMAFHGGLMDAPQTDGASSGEAPGEPRGLRPWQAGDSPKRMVWPATLRSLAKGAGLVVRECDPPGFRPQRCAVLVHSFGVDGGLICPDRFEKTLSLAAGTLNQLHSQGMPARLIADFDDWKSHPAHTRSQLAFCMEILAEARRAAGTEAHDLQNALADVHGDEGLVILSDMPVASWRNSLPREKRSAFTPESAVIRKRKEAAR